MQNEETEVARKLLQHTFGGGHDLSQLIGPSRLTALDHISPSDLAALIAGEKLQVQAVILAHVDARKSFETLEEIPPRKRSQLLLRISKLEPVSAAILDDLNKTLRSKIHPSEMPG